MKWEKIKMPKAESQGLPIFTDNETNIDRKE